MTTSTFLRAIATAALLLIPQIGWSVFDPVNDDTDIFLANPQVSSSRPNVLIFVDNTANWGQAQSGVSKYTAVRTALNAVLNNVVTDGFNVGLALFVETGGGNNNVDGAYMRFGLRQMSGAGTDATTNKGKLVSLITALDINGDKGNGAVYSLAYAEVFKYFAGINAMSGYGKAKTDAGDTVYITGATPLRQTMVGSPLPTGANLSAATTSPYVSPIVSGCQKNYIVFISNGTANDNSSAISAATTQYTNDTGSAPVTIPLSPSGEQGVLADEYAKYMATADCNASIPGVQTVVSYAIDVLPGTTGGGPAHTALLQSMASNGKGKYYAITDITTTTQIETALTQVFQEVQQVNSVFASTTLPVSVNVRGTNLNQVYIGVFRPDANKSPRWFGNLKLYKLGINSATSQLFLADATGAPAENASSGFISASAQSYWTASSSFWQFRDSTVNGSGGISDLPDGDLVEKGGAAQQLRIAYSADQSTRNVYTCINGTGGLCSSGASLSATPFNTSNISPGDVGAYNSVPVTSMSAAEETSTTSIVSVITSAAHGLVAGNTVRIEGASPTAYNGNFTVLASPLPTVTTFSYRINTVLSSDRARGISTNHGMNSGDFVIIDTLPNEYDALSPGTVVTRIDANTFEYTVASPSTGHTGPITTSKSRKSVTALSAPVGTGTTARATVPSHNYGAAGATIAGPGITISGANESPFNCTPGSITIVDADSFKYAACSTVSGTSNTAQVSTPGHTFSSGQTIRIRDTGNAAYDGNDFSIAKLDSTDFTFGLGSAPSVSTGIAGFLITSIAQSGSTMTVTTSAAHSFVVGTSIRVRGSSCSNQNVTDVAVLSTPTATTFTVSGGSGCANFSGTGAVAGFRIVSIVAVISATGTIYSDKNITISSISPLSQATGVITAGNPNSGDTATRDLIVNWARGQDDNENENNDCTVSPFYPCGGTNLTPRKTDVRTSVHGDVLHSRPAVVDYNRYGDDNDVYAYYGSNDGLLRALKGGVTFHTTGADTTRVPGSERWSFVPKEFFGRLKRLRNQTPTISNVNQKDYFFDGSIGVYTKDVAGTGNVASPGTGSVLGVIGDNSGDKVYVYLSLRRGGDFIYALDVTNPGNPKLLWREGFGDAGWEQVGQTWSEPKVARVAASIGNTNNPDNVVLIFGAGYDDAVEDITPCLISSETTTAVVQKAIGTGSVTYTASGSCTISNPTGSTTSFSRSRGTAILVVDAFNGNVVWQAASGIITSGTGLAAGSQRKLNVPDMTCAIPSDTSVLDKNRDGFADRVYVGDTCGQVWRADIGSSSMDEWTVTKIAALSSTTATDIANKRKLLFAPDLVFGTDATGNYTAVLLGSGDREHPFDSVVVNRFYMLKDRDSSDTLVGAPNSSSVKISGFGTTPTGSPYADSDLFDATNTALVSGTDPLGLNGWKITLGAGEKVVSTSTSVGGSTFFNTNQPTGLAQTGTCGSDLGIAREYIVGFADAAATVDLNASGTVTIADRSTIHPGGGYLPSPVPVVVEIDGKKYQAVISGTAVQTPPGVTLEKRTRTFWYKELD